MNLKDVELKEKLQTYIEGMNEFDEKYITYKVDTFKPILEGILKYIKTLEQYCGEINLINERLVAEKYDLNEEILRLKQPVVNVRPKVRFISDDKVEIFDVASIDYENKQIFFRRDDDIMYNLGFGVRDVQLIGEDKEVKILKKVLNDIKEVVNKLEGMKILTFPDLPLEKNVRAIMRQCNSGYIEILQIINKIKE